MQIIPAIDILDGNCVRLFQGNYEESKTYHQNPVEQAQIFESIGVKRLHIVDLNGAKEGKPVNLSIVKDICSKTKLIVEVGGGIRDIETARKYLDLGVHKIILGSILTKNPDIVCDFIKEFKPESLIAGIDFKNNLVSVSGWLETTSLEPLEFAEILKNKGAREFIFTDISKDGTLAGSNVAFYKKASLKLGGGVIASGGIGSDHDIQELSAIQNLLGVIVGKAYYEKRVDLSKWV